MTSLVHTARGRSAARAYCGMWIVDCHHCRNAWHVDRFTPAWECSYCGIHIEIIWPAEDTVYSIERLLLMRPIPYTQNWNPGETLHELMQENAEHGVFEAVRAVEASPGALWLSVDDSAIRSDMLPVSRRRELRRIGA